MATKRDQTSDNQILDALEASDGNFTKAAHKLGIQRATLSKWVLESENLKGLIALRVADDAVLARDTLHNVLTDCDHENKDFTGHIIRVCQILLDKAEANKLDVTSTVSNKIDIELSNKIKDLLG